MSNIHQYLDDLDDDVQTFQKIRRGARKIEGDARRQKKKESIKHTQKDK